MIYDIMKNVLIIRTYVTGRIHMKLRHKIIAGILGVLLVFVGSLCHFSAEWYIQKFGDTGFDSILFTLFSEKGGISEEVMQEFFRIALHPTLIATGISIVLFVLLACFTRWSWYLTAVSLAACIALCANAASTVKLPEYLRDYANATQLFENEYVHPDKAEIVFPEKKRNLIYIMLESMENTFFSTEEGGALEENVIPELYDLALENVNFSHTDGVGGCNHSTGATWTSGAIVAQTAGVPLKMPWEIRNQYDFEVSMLPGVSSIVEILKENGYSYTFMCGSNATYGARAQYFEQHGADRIVDYYTAVNEGIVMEDYFEWWGLTDSDLYMYAQIKLEELAEQDEPFAMTLLTVDTHSPGGYICSLCMDDYEEQYDNVLACASYQLYDFLDWLSWQDFYEDTTIVVVGDHLSMDNDYMLRILGDQYGIYERSLYNCFINSAVDPVNEKNRVFTQFDLFPTTLAAMGAEIPGERLALGTNLFSDVPTLAEKMGFDVLDQELGRASEMYRNQFMIPPAED